MSHWTGDISIHWQYSPLANTSAQDLLLMASWAIFPTSCYPPLLFLVFKHLIHPSLAEAKHSSHFITQAVFALSNFKLILDKLQMQSQWWLTKMFLLNKAVFPWGIVSPAFELSAHAPTYRFYSTFFILKAIQPAKYSVLKGLGKKPGIRSHIIPIPSWP